MHCERMAIWFRFQETAGDLGGAKRAELSTPAVQWAGQLGDGRAISLGQAVGPDGTPYELQLKVGMPHLPGLHAKSCPAKSLCIYTPPAKLHSTESQVRRSSSW